MRIAMLVMLCSVGAAADNVLIRPYPGSASGGREVRKKESIVVPDGVGRTLAIRGNVTRFVWKNPKGKRLEDVYSAYERELTQGGFRVLWSCAGKDCGRAVDVKFVGKVPADAAARFVLGQLKRAELGDVYAAIQVTQAQATLAIVEETASPEQKDEAVKEAVAAAKRVTAGAIRESIVKDGYVTLGDILYRPGEVALRPEAQVVVKEIAAVLRAQPDLRLHVVGHTDSQGQLASNFAVSKKRASWLVKELVKEGIPAARLRPDGVGPLAPVTSNDTAEGRARNRRVELVRQ